MPPREGELFIGKGTVKVRLQDISIGVDSSWRKLDLEHKNHLVDAFLRGESASSDPLLRNVNGRSKLDAQGLKLLINGKHTVAALLECMKIFQVHDNEMEAFTFTPSLAKVFTEGLECRVGEFADDSTHAVVSYCVCIHDVGSTKLKASTMNDCVEVVQRFRNRAPGTTWESTKTRMLSFYGTRKSRWVYRCVVAAQTLTPAILFKLAELNIPNKWIHDNMYFTGQGADRTKRLSEKSQSLVLDMVSSDKESRKDFSLGLVTQEYCVPAWVAENWLAEKKRIYLGIAEKQGVESRGRIPFHPTWTYSSFRLLATKHASRR